MVLFIFTFMLTTILVENASAIWCFQCSEFESKKCPSKCNDIEEWKNSSCKCPNNVNHVTADIITNNQSCIIGTINETIVFQVIYILIQVWFWKIVGQP